MESSGNIFSPGRKPAWNIGRGDQVRIGKDPWIGCKGNFSFS